jgi:hypothetical protein
MMSGCTNRSWNGPGRARQRRQRRRTGLAALDDGLAPYHLLHAVLRRHPRSAGLAPARGRGDAEFQLLFLRQPCGEAEGVGPVGTHVGQALGDELRRHHLGIEILQATQAAARHPVDVLLDSFLGDIPVQPVPPHARTGALRRIVEACGERVGARGPGGREQASDGRCQCGAAKCMVVSWRGVFVHCSSQKATRAWASRPRDDGGPGGQDQKR